MARFITTPISLKDLSQPIPEGFTSIDTHVAMRCKRCGREITGTGYTLQELADRHVREYHPRVAKRKQI